jgi:hypothetical protein
LKVALHFNIGVGASRSASSKWMQHPVLQNEQRSVVCCILGFFCPSLLVASVVGPTINSHRASLSLPPRRNPASLRPPPPCLLPWLPRRLDPAVRREREGASAAAEGPTVWKTGPSSPAAGLLSPSSALAPITPLPELGGGSELFHGCTATTPSSASPSFLDRATTARMEASAPSGEEQGSGQRRKARRPPSSGRQPAPPPPSLATGGADPGQPASREPGRASASASRPSPCSSSTSRWSDLAVGLLLLLFLSPMAAGSRHGSTPTRGRWRGRGRQSWSLPPFIL